MPVLLITYDLNRPGQDYPGLLEEIRSTSWARLSESSYAVDTSESASAVYDRVRPHIDDGDNIFIITLSAPWRSWGPEDVNNWLSSRL